MSGEGPVPREGEGRHPISPRHPQVNCRSCAYHHICGFTENVYWLLQKTQGQVRLFFLCPGCHAQHGSDSAGGREAAAWPSGFPSAYWMPRSRFLRGIPGFQKPPWSFLNADPPRVERAPRLGRVLPARPARPHPLSTLHTGEPETK